MIVIRRPSRVARVSAPVAPAAAPPKRTPEEERERLVRRRDVHRKAEVLGEFLAVGAVVDRGDPLRVARGRAVGGAS